MALYHILLEGPLSQPVWAAITKYHRLGGLNNKHLFLTVLVAGKSKIKVPENRVPAEGPLPYSVTAVFSLCHHMAEGVRELWVPLFIRALIPCRRALAL